MDQLKNTMAQLQSILDFSVSDPSNGTLFDTRDGQSYKVVKIGKQIWLAENFRYLPSIKDKGDKYETSCVYNNDNNYLDKGYGRLYDWNTAKSIAPEGWKLPSKEDFQELKDFIIKDNNLTVGEVGSYLKSINGWNKSFNSELNNDKYGFNVKPAGYISNINNIFTNVENNTCFWSFWSATKGSSVSINLYHYEGLGDQLSVRLIKDSL